MFSWNQFTENQNFMQKLGEQGEEHANQLFTELQTKRTKTV